MPIFIIPYLIKKVTARGMVFFIERMYRVQYYGAMVMLNDTRQLWHLYFRNFNGTVYTGKRSQGHVEERYGISITNRHHSIDLMVSVYFSLAGKFNFR